MNDLYKNSFRSIMCTAILCIGIGSAFADEEVPFPEVIPVEQEANLVENSANLSCFMGMVNHLNDGYYLQRIHRDGYYHLVAFTDNGDQIQLQDASKWEVERSGRQKVLYWVQKDDIFIKPNVHWFSSYRYVLHNRTVNQTVEVNLVSPPLPMGALTFRIVNIHPYDRLVLLSDHTIWKVGPESHFSYWQIGQRVMVGVNNKWRTEAYPQIFINVDLAHEPYCQAAFYGYPATN